MRFFWIVFFLISVLVAPAQERGLTKNVVVITFDGFRWHELFAGADSANLFGSKYNTQDSAWRVKKHWAADSLQRREKLMPFFWNNFAKKGQVYGNRKYGNFVNVSNRYWFSYPGYNEIFTGYPDTLVNSNSHPANHNVSVLEFLNRLPGFSGKVASFTSWDAFYKILNEKRSGITINSGFNNMPGDSLSDVQLTLNDMQHWLPKMFGGGQRHDAVTYSMAKEFVKLHKPRVLHIGFIETDATAHDGKYDYYLDAAHYNDAMIGDLWNYMQSDPFYKDQTTFIITEDHGRGYGDNWRHHYYSVPHSNEIFFAVMGPDTKALGEVKTKGQLYQNQFAQTIAALLGLQFENGHETGKPIKEVSGK